MSLNSNARALLDACATSIVRNSEYGLDLYSLSRFFVDTDEVVQSLAHSVEAHSNNKWTIRRADVAFFDVLTKGVNLYLVLCPYSTPLGEVVELTNEMRLISLGPYENGLDIDAKQASPEAVQLFRDRAAKRKLEQEQRELAQADVERFMEWLEGDSPKIAAELRSKSSVTLADLAVACRKHDFPLMMLLLERSH